jgi:transposase, IS30 family
MDSDLTSQMEYSADVGQQENEKRGTAKGPALKIGKDHKLVACFEKPLVRKVNPHMCNSKHCGQGLQFQTRISVFSIIEGIYYK